ncbi:Gfo/Idh/MocA family protein [Haloferula sp.]|uniref:Gfo/Idh/MocA family protein n=1 Tax=Haloferula sp. TaxID=2497595 RepID=UPI00329AAC84
MKKRMNVDRRRFLRTAGAAALAPAVGRAAGSGANEQIRVAVIGLGTRGPAIAWNLLKIPDVELVAICDADTERMDDFEKKLSKDPKAGRGVKKVQDFRKVMDDPEIDAVMICTPNHWHAHMTLMACEAGKDAMVEKPVCHTIWEGWRMMEAAKKHGRIITGGFQNRGDSGLIRFFDYLESESQPVGKLESVNALWHRFRESIGKRKSPLKPPASVDYNLWLGPAMDEPIYREKFHYDWHWMWNTGSGEMGNLGAHNLDIARWAIGDPKDKPVRVLSAGNRFVWDDAGETPNMHWARYDFGNGIPFTVEVRDLNLKPDVKRLAGFKGISSGMILKYEGGEFRGGRGGGKLYGNDNKVIEKFAGDGGKDHLVSFFNAVRSRNESDLRCKLEDAVYSSQCVLMGGLATRIGSPATPDDISKVMSGEPKAVQGMWEHMGEHLENWDIDYAKEPWMLGPELTYDWKAQHFSAASEPAALAKAQALHQRSYREAFPFPKV